MEFNGIEWNFQWDPKCRLFRGEMQEIASKLLLTFWGGRFINTDLPLVIIKAGLWNTPKSCPGFEHAWTISSSTPHLVEKLTSWVSRAVASRCASMASCRAAFSSWEQQSVWWPTLVYLREILGNIHEYTIFIVNICEYHIREIVVSL